MNCLVISTIQYSTSIIRGWNNLNRLTTIPNQKSESPTLYGIGIVSHNVAGFRILIWIRIRIRWIRIQSGQWIRIRIRNPDPDPGGQK
jgi:hypothetical protein